MQGFEEVKGLSELLLATAPAFLKLIHKHPADDPILSPAIERLLNIRGPHVRALRRWAWAKGYPVASSGRGYYWAASAEEWVVVEEHIRHRYQAEQVNLANVTAIGDKMRLSGPIKTPLDLQAELRL